MPRSNTTPNASPNFSGPPRMGVASISAANTNRDGTGTIVTVLASVAGGADVSGGTRIDFVDIKATGTTTAGMIRLYVSTDTGASWKLIREIVVNAITPSASLAAFETQLELSRDLPAGTANLLGASTHNAEAFNVTAWGGDYT
jgi:hypothetical protein